MAITGLRQGFFSRYIGVLLHPRRTFEALIVGGGRGWLWMALLSMLFVALPVLAGAPISARQAQEQFRTQMEARSGPSQTLTPEQVEQAEQFTANPLVTLVFPLFGGLAGLWLGWLVWAGALYLLSTVLGGSNSFGQTWQVVLWSWLPYTLRGLLQTVFILLTGSLIEHPGLSGFVADPRTATEALAAPPGTGQLLLQALLSRFDLFLFWNLALLAIGLIVAARFSRRKAILLTLLVWLLLTVLGLVPVMISSSFARGFSGS